MALKSDEARTFYAEEATSKRLSVRGLRAAISRKAYERREIANSQIPEGSAVPRDTFRDPLILDTLGLHDTYLEKDLEAAILRDVQAFLLEVGREYPPREDVRTLRWSGPSMTSRVGHKSPAKYLPNLHHAPINPQSADTPAAARRLTTSGSTHGKGNRQAWELASGPAK